MTGNEGHVILTDEIEETVAGATPDAPVLELPNIDPIKTATEKFDFSDPPINPILLSNTLTKFLYDWGGYNLYANYVGIPYRVIVIRGMESAMFNPRVIYEDTENILSLEEGSIAHKGLIVKVPRSRLIRVRYEDAFGKTTTESFSDISARAILNSIDGLDGYLFYNRASKFHKDQALRKWRKVKKLL